MPTSAGPVRPFVDVRFGWRSASTEVDGEEVSNTSALAIGGGAGLHLFANEHVSIDPGFHGYFLSGSYKSGDLEMDGSGYTVMMSLALSAWIGGKRSEWDPQETIQSPAWTRSSDSDMSNESFGATPIQEDQPVRTDSRIVESTIRIGEEASIPRRGGSRAPTTR